MPNGLILDELKSYMANIVEGIEKGHKVAGVTFITTSEKDLELFVRTGQPDDVTLLRILGYDDKTVLDHPKLVIKIGVVEHTFEPDYVLHQDNKNLAILELKSPSEDLDNPKWAVRILSYCDATNAPLGLLFNGCSLRIFVNTSDKQRLLKKYREDIGADPVVLAEHTDLNGLIRALSDFNFNALQVKAINLVVKLASSRTNILANKQRQHKIREILAKILTSDSPDEVVGALATVDSLSGDFDPKPTDSDLLVAWKLVPPALPPKPSLGKSGANLALKAKIAEICEKKSFNVIQAAGVKGLTKPQSWVDWFKDSGFAQIVVEHLHLDRTP